VTDSELTVKIGAQVDQLVAALAQASSQARSAGAAIKAGIGGEAQKAGDDLAGMGNKGASAGKETGAAAKSAGQQLAELRKRAIQLAEAYGVLRAYEWGKSLVESGSEVGEQLKRLHEETGASVEALSRLQFAAAATGTPFSAVQMALRRTQMEYAQLAAGSKNRSLIVAMEQLGIRAHDLTDLPALFHKLQAAQSRLTPENFRAFTSAMLGARGGIELIPLITSNLSSLDEQARRTGATLGDAIVAKDAEVADSFRELGVVWDATKAKITAALAPAIEQLLELLTKLAGAIGEWAATPAAQGAIAALAQTFRNFGGEVKAVGPQLTAFAGELNSLLKTAASVAAFFAAHPIIARMAAGAAAGGTIGSVIPGVGTAAGALTGAIGGAALGIGAEGEVGKLGAGLSTAAAQVAASGLPPMQEGGAVTATGLAIVHAGETVVPRQHAAAAMSRALGERDVLQEFYQAPVHRAHRGPDPAKEAHKQAVTEFQEFRASMARQAALAGSTSEAKIAALRAEGTVAMQLFGQQSTQYRSLQQRMTEVEQREAARRAASEQRAAASHSAAIDRQVREAAAVGAKMTRDQAQQRAQTEEQWGGAFGPVSAMSSQVISRAMAPGNRENFGRIMQDVATRSMIGEVAGMPGALLGGGEHASLAAMLVGERGKGGGIAGLLGAAGAQPMSMLGGEDLLAPMRRALSGAFAAAQPDVNNLFGDAFVASGGPLSSVMASAAEDALGGGGGGGGGMFSSLLDMFGGGGGGMFSSLLDMFGGGGGGLGSIFSSALSLGSLFGFERGGIVPSAAGGMIVGPGHGTLAMLHPREMVLPSRLSEGMQRMTSGGGNTARNLTVHNNFSAIDSRGMRELLQEHSGTIVNAIQRELRDSPRGGTGFQVT
jgi:hypothetical protein